MKERAKTCKVYLSHYKMYSDDEKEGVPLYTTQPLVTLCQGENVTLTFPGNPTTGYVMQIESVDKSLLDVSLDYKPRTNTTGMTGVGGHYTLSIRTSRMVSTEHPTLTFIVTSNARPWTMSEKDADAATFDLRAIPVLVHCSVSAGPQGVT